MFRSPLRIPPEIVHEPIDATAEASRVPGLGDGGLVAALRHAPEDIAARPPDGLVEMVPGGHGRAGVSSGRSI